MPDGTGASQKGRPVVTITTIASEAERLREIADHGEKLQEEREAAIADTFAVIEQLVPLVHNAVQADMQLHAVRGQLGQHEVHRDSRDRIVARLHGRLSDLRPFIPFVSDPEEQE